jgi:hypothetical protein
VNENPFFTAKVEPKVGKKFTLESIEDIEELKTKNVNLFKDVTSVEIGSKLSGNDIEVSFDSSSGCRISCGNVSLENKQICSELEKYITQKTNKTRNFFYTHSYKFTFGFIFPFVTIIVLKPTWSVIALGLILLFDFLIILTLSQKSTIHLNSKNEKPPFYKRHKETLGKIGWMVLGVVLTIIGGYILHLLTR